MSQDVDDGLYDDVLIPMAEATIRLITRQMPDGYAYDLDECRVIRFDPDLPDSFTIKGDAGNDLPVPAATIIHPSELEADPERYETRERPTPAPSPDEEKYWEERIRRMTQMSQDVDDGLYDDVLDPLREAADRLLTTQMPHGYAYDLDECIVVRTDPNLPVYFTIKSDAGDDLPVGAPTVIHPSELEADPERYETRERPTPAPSPDEEKYWEESVRRMTQMSQDTDDGLYDDVFGPTREAAFEHLITQISEGYAYDLDECQIVRLDPNRPSGIVIKSEAGDDIPLVIPRVVSPEEVAADPERYETRTRYWKERLRRVAQDVDDGLYDDAPPPMANAASRLITSQMPDGYAYDIDKCLVVRYDRDRPIPSVLIIRPADLWADPERRKTRT